MAPAKTQHYTIQGPSAAFNLVPAEPRLQRNITDNNQPNPNTGFLPMSLTPSYFEEKGVHRALQVATPELDVERIVRLPTARVSTLWNISVADGKSMVLSGAPVKKALRSEDKAVSVEAAAVHWLTSLPPPGREPSEGGNHIVYGGCEPGRSLVNYTGDSVNVSYVSQFLPKLVKFIPKQDEQMPKGDLALWEPTHGKTIAQLGRQLTDMERKIVDFQAGQLFRRLACHVSPTGNFGPIAHVLKSRSKIPSYHAMGFLHPVRGEEPPSDIGRKSWSMCFKGYIEEVWDDLGDFYVQMRFDVLRNHFHRFEHLLDRIEIPRLVAIQGGADENVMVSIPGEADQPVKGGWAVKGPRSPALTRCSNNTKVEESHETGPIRVTGLRDWSNFCFGDPLMSYVFQDDPSTEFHRGSEANFSDSEDPFLQHPLIEDEEHAPVRLALYKAWHAACGVARQYRRASDQEKDWEMLWRIEFTDALETLDNFDDDGHQISTRHRAAGNSTRGARSGGHL